MDTVIQDVAKDATDSALGRRAPRRRDVAAWMACAPHGCHPTVAPLVHDSLLAMGLWDPVEHDHVMNAVREYDALGQDRFLSKYGFRPARDYVLIVAGRSYDSKAILGAAYGYATGAPLPSSRFTGGSGATGAATVLRRLGFDVAGEARTAPASPQARRPATDDHAAVQPERVGSPDILLVGCVKTKQHVAAPARELYMSPLFRKRRTYADDTGRPWFVLSALHGLVAPDQVLQPYDMYLAGQSREYRRQWAARVTADLQSAVGRPLAGLTIEIHAGNSYVVDLAPLLRDQGATVLTPLQGLTQGQHLAWYDDHRPRQQEPSDDLAGVEAAAATAMSVLTSAPQPAEAFPWGRHDLDRPGLYTWWTDSKGAEQLGLAEPPEGLAIIYAGQAGATKWPTGQTSNATLLSRIRSNHLGGNISSSTLRQTLAALLLEPLDLRVVGPKRLDSDSERALSTWVAQRLHVAVWPHDDRGRLGRIERLVIAALDAPLNLSGSQRSDLRQRLRAGRAALRI